MKTYAHIASRSVRISGHPHSGWRAADPNEQDAKLVNFRFSISDDGSGNFLLAYSSLDNAFAADSWHETIDEAYRLAEEMFDIKRSDWLARNAV